MNRRETLKSLVIGTVSTGLILNGCKTNIKDKEAEVAWDDGGGYGRTPEELLHDHEIRSKGSFFDEHQRKVVTILADIIVPAEGDYPAASEVGTVEFIDFMMRDDPKLQLPITGGLCWMDYESMKRFGSSFDLLSEEERIRIVEDIAYPYEAAPEFVQGASFFSLMRNLVGTGYFTSQEGIQDLGYIGNVPNVWDGVPDDILQDHGLSYDEKLLDTYLKPEDRGKLPEWDADKNLIG